MYTRTTNKMRVWFWRLAIALALVGAVLTQVAPVSADGGPPEGPPSLSTGQDYVWGG